MKIPEKILIGLVILVVILSVTAMVLTRNNDDDTAKVIDVCLALPLFVFTYRYIIPEKRRQYHNLASLIFSVLSLIVLGLVLAGVL